MLRLVTAYAVTAIVFVGLDVLFISRIALELYRREIGGLLLERPNLAIAALFYLLFAAGIVVLAVLPALSGGGWMSALVSGAVLGLVAYGTYDLTNLSTLKQWSLTVTLADIAWGTALTALSAAAATLVATALDL